MPITQQRAIFAPVISLMDCFDGDAEISMHVYARMLLRTHGKFLSSATKDEVNARELAGKMLKRRRLFSSTTSLSPTADPRIPFGGRGASGYGVTRGVEGLLEMTAVKTVIVRRGGRMRHLEPTREADVPLLDALIRAAHGGGWSKRFQAMRDVVTFSRRSR